MRTIVRCETPENAALMRRFCSLGQNCEFGFAQRFCGAEPIDLFRWAASPFRVLMDLLRDQFVGIGDGLTLRTLPDREYMVQNPRYGFEWHAWAKEGEIEPDQLIQRESVRVPRIAEKMVETLADGDRIFVRLTRAPDAVAQGRALLAAIRERGPGRLLCVGEDPARAGMVEDAGKGLLLGYLDAFEDIVQLAHTDVWLAVCRNAATIEG